MNTPSDKSDNSKMIGSPLHINKETGRQINLDRTTRILYVSDKGEATTEYKLDGLPQEMADYLKKVLKPSTYERIGIQVKGKDQTYLAEKPPAAQEENVFVLREEDIGEKELENIIGNATEDNTTAHTPEEKQENSVLQQYKIIIYGSLEPKSEDAVYTTGLMYLINEKLEGIQGIEVSVEDKVEAVIDDYRVNRDATRLFVLTKDLKRAMKEIEKIGVEGKAFVLIDGEEAAELASDYLRRFSTIRDQTRQVVIQTKDRMRGASTEELMNYRTNIAKDICDIVKYVHGKNQY